MSARHPVKLNPNSDGYCDPSNTSLIRIFWEDDGWAIDAAQLDDEGNVVGYTDACWKRDSFSEILETCPEFVTEIVPHLLARQPFDPIDLLPLVNDAIAAINTLVMASLGVPNIKAALPEWMTKSIEEADLLVNHIQDHLVDPDVTGSTYEDRVGAKAQELIKRKQAGGDCTQDESVWILNYFDLHEPTSAFGTRMAETYTAELDQWAGEREAGDRPHFPPHRLLRWLAENITTKEG